MGSAPDSDRRLEQDLLLMSPILLNHSTTLQVVALQDGEGAEGHVTCKLL